MEEHLSLRHTFFVCEVMIWRSEVGKYLYTRSVCTMLYFLFIYLFIYFFGQHNPFQDESTSCLPPGAKSLMFDNPQGLTAIFCESINNLQLHQVNEAKTALKLCDELTSFCEVTMSMYEVKGHFWGMCDLQSSLCMRSEVGMWCERCNWRSNMPRNWLLTSSILIVTSQHDVTSGVARGGRGGNCPLAETLPPPLAPMKSHFVQRSMVSRHFESQSAPLTWAPLAAPSFWSLAMPLDVTRSHLIISKLFWFSLTWRNCIFAWLTKIIIESFLIVVYQWICKWWKTRC